MKRAEEMMWIRGMGTGLRQVLVPLLNVIYLNVAGVGNPALAGPRPWWAPHGAFLIY